MQKSILSEFRVCLNVPKNRSKVFKKFIDPGFLKINQPAMKNLMTFSLFIAIISIFSFTNCSAQNQTTEVTPEIFEKYLVAKKKQLGKDETKIVPENLRKLFILLNQNRKQRKMKLKTLQMQLNRPPMLRTSKHSMIKSHI